MIIYYDSKTGNVKRFIEKIKQTTGWQCMQISDAMEVSDTGHLVTYTTQIGCVAESTKRFMEQYSRFVFTVSSSGNMNWGENFALAADKIAAEYKIPILIKFELSGLDRDVTTFIQKIKEYGD